MIFDRTIITIILLIQGIFANHDTNVRDGAEHIRKLVHKEHLEIEKPDVLLFTAPYRICKNGCTGSDRNINFAMSFPLILGNYGKKLYNQLYPNDARKPEHLFKTKPTRGPFTTCSPYEKVKRNRSTKSTMYPGFVVGTKSTGYPGLEIRKTRSTGYDGYNEFVRTRSTGYDGYNEFVRTRSTGYHGYSEGAKETRSTAYHGHSDGTKRTLSTDNQGYRETLSTRLRNFEDYRKTRRVNFLHYKPFLTRSRDSAYPDYAELKNTRELDVLQDKSPREHTLPEAYYPAKEDGAHYPLQSEQYYTYWNSITPNTIDSHSKKMRWLKMSLNRKTINDMISPNPSLMRRLAPLRREPKNYQDSISANQEVRERNEQSPFGFMPVLPIQ